MNRKLQDTETSSSLSERLRARAKIRRQITTRKSVLEGKPDRVADLLEEAADELDKWRPMTDEEYKADKGA